MWVVPRSSLTEDQLNAVLMSTARHRVVVGGPGSGKTLVLAHRAQHLLEGGADPSRVRLLVFTKVLSSYIEAGLNDLGIPRQCVSTFDSLSVTLYNRLVNEPRPMAGAKKDRLDFDAMRSAVLAKLRTSAEPPPFDAILVDEGQDLDGTAIELLAAAATHVTIAVDSRQQLYATGMTVERACSLLGVQRASANLLTAYRCTPLIVDVAAEFLPAEEADLFRSANLLSIDGVETPVLYTSRDDDAEMDVLARHLGERAMAGHTTAVLVPTRRAEVRVIKALSQRDVAVATRTTMFVGDLRPIVLTYHSAKGMTVDDVFLPGLTKSEFSRRGAGATIETMIFVGVTRATRWAWLGTWEGDALGELDRLQALANRRSLVALPIRTSTPSQASPASTPSTSPAQGVQALQPGDRVAHASWGVGTVVRLEGEGSGRVAHVDFGNGIVRRALLLYVTLEKVTEAEAASFEPPRAARTPRRPRADRPTVQSSDLSDLL